MRKEQERLAIERAAKLEQERLEREARIEEARRAQEIAEAER